MHGFVLAGGKSSRMGRDKALLEFRGRPLVASAIKTLSSFCTAVSVSGDRDDLLPIAPVIRDARGEAGPAAGMEAGLAALTEPWALFVPVDVPLVPEPLLRGWAEAVLGREGDGVRLSFLRVGGQRQPTFCLLHRGCAAPLREVLDRGDRKLGIVFERVAEALGPVAMWVADAEAFAAGGSETSADVLAWFTNVNTPEDLARLARWERDRTEAK